LPLRGRLLIGALVEAGGRRCRRGCRQSLMPQRVRLNPCLQGDVCAHRGGADPARAINHYLIFNIAWSSLYSIFGS